MSVPRQPSPDRSGEHFVNNRAWSFIDVNIRLEPGVLPYCVRK